MSMRDAATPVPFVVQAGSAANLCALLCGEREELSRQLRISGAILFRGFGVTDAQQLAVLPTAVGNEPMRYWGGDSPRTDVDASVYTSTEAPAAIAIPLHNEMSYLGSYPRHLWMACARPARRGGETVLGDGRAIRRAIDPEVRRRFVRHGIRYRCIFRGPTGARAILDRFFKAHKSWMDAFETESRAQVAERCASIGVEHRWLRSGQLRLDTLRPATLRHPETGELAWFNQAHLFRLHPRYLGVLRYLLARALFRDPETRSHHACFGDGSEIERATLEHLYDVLDAHRVPVAWEPGDVLWIDNLSCMHGREPFRGPRRVLVTMSA
jgi:alpha-ketoglutarate-dependent taurine dioxygenase